MNNQVFLQKSVNVGEIVIYNGSDFIVTDSVNLKGKSIKNNTLSDLPITEITFPLWEANRSVGTTKEQTLRHVFNFFLDKHLPATDVNGNHAMNPVLRTDCIKKTYYNLPVDETFIGIANKKHNMLLYIDNNGTPMTSDETFFEYAYRNKVFVYCDMCMQHWTTTHEKNEDIMDVLSYISQPPMNSIIQTPVFCMFVKERSYDRNTAYERDYIQKIIETNETNFEIEEPAYAEEMSEEQFNELAENYENGIYKEVCIQIDSYDAYFMNTEFMTKKNVLQFLQDKAYRNRTHSIQDLFPPKRDRKRCQGIHFVSIPLPDQTTQVPMQLFNFTLFEEYLFHNIIFDDEIEHEHKLQMRQSVKYQPPRLDINSLLLEFTFHEDIEGEDPIPWRGVFQLKAETSTNDPVHFCFELYRKEEQVFFRMFHVLLFATDSEHEPMRLICTDLNDTYEHPQERIIERGTVSDMAFGADGSRFITVQSSDDNTIVVSNEPFCVPTPPPVNIKARDTFNVIMQQHARQIRFPDKSYALKKINFGLYHIPRTVYAPNKLRLSNGKIPKKYKAFESTWKSSSDSSCYVRFCNKIRSLKDVIPEEVTATEAKQDVPVTLSEVVDMINMDQLLEMHDLLQAVSFVERNKIIMQLRKTEDLKYPFSKLFPCIMSRASCTALIKKSTMQEDWTAFYTGTGEMPKDLSIFKIDVETLEVSEYIKQKLISKIGKTFKISPLILGMLMQKDVPDTILQFCKNTKVTDNDLFPIHFVVHFCEDAVKRKENVIRLLKQETIFKDIIRPHSYNSVDTKWNPQNSKDLCILGALCEWPFDSLFQAFFLLTFPMNMPNCIYKKRNWFKNKTFIIGLFADTPGHHIVEHRMKNYGYPPQCNFLQSWQEGFLWFSNIGLMRTIPKFIQLVESTKHGKMIYPGDQDTLDELNIFMACYEHQQTEKCMEFQTILINKDKSFTFDDFFQAELNIHQEPINGRLTFYQYMLTRPQYWADTSCCFSYDTFASKLGMHYLNTLPELDPYFKPLEHIYIDLRFSLFAQEHTSKRYSSSVLLCRSGGTVQQLRTLHSITNQVKSTHTQFMYTDLQHILSEKVHPKLFISPYLKSKYVASSPTHWNFPFRADGILDILGSEELLKLSTDRNKNKLKQEIARRVSLVVQYMELYMKNCTFENISKRLENPELYRTDNQTNRYIYFIHKLTDVLFDVASTLYKLGKSISRRGTSPGTVFFFLVSCPVWNETYIHDVKRFHFMLTNQPTLLSHAAILFFDELDIGQIWWKTWKEDLETTGHFQSEMLRIFRANTINLRKDTFFYHAVQFIFKYIVDIDHIDCQPCYKIAHRTPDRMANYVFLGTVLMDVLMDIKTIGSSINEKVDKLLHKIIVNTHHADLTTKFEHNQHLDFFYMIAPTRLTSKMTKSKREKLFNAMCSIFLKLNLPISMVAFFHSVEKHMDYQLMDQKTPHLFKNIVHGHIQPNNFMHHFVLDKANVNLLLTHHKDPHAHVYWQVLLMNLHFNGSLPWEYFHSKLEEEDMSDLHHMYNYHMQILTHVKNGSGTTYYFRKDLIYSVPFFVQHGLNPFLFDFMQCKEDRSKGWINQLLQTKMTKLIGWPFNMYFSHISKPLVYAITDYNFERFASESIIDHMFTVNEGMYGFDYRNILTKKSFCDSETQTGIGVKHRLHGKYILEATSFLGFTIMAMYQKQPKLRFTDVMSFVQKVYLASNLPLKYIMGFEHAVVKSQSGQHTIIHAKLHMFSILEMFCDDFTATDLEILMEKTNGFQFSEEDLQKRATHTEVEKLAYAQFIVQQVKDTIQFSIQFSDNVDIFQVYIKWICIYFQQLNISVQHLFTTYLLPIETNHTFIETKMYTFDVDILTFVCQYGREEHIAFLIRVLQGKTLWNLQRRLKQQSTDAALKISGVHLGYLHSSKDPVEHLLYLTAINGHVNSFFRIFQTLSNDQLEKIGTIIKDLVKTIKFETSSCDEMALLLQRKRQILKTILTNKKVKTNYLMLGPAYSYLHGHSQTVLDKPQAYLTLVKPTYVQNRHFMRTTLETWGNHIFECILILNEHMQPAKIHIKKAINLTLLYSAKLTNYVLDQYVEDKHETKSAVCHFEQMNPEIVKYINAHDEVEPRKFLYVFYLLHMENRNRNTSIKEIISNGYLEHFLTSILVEEDIIVLLKFSVEFFSETISINDFVDFVNTLRLPKRRKTEATL